MRDIELILFEHDVTKAREAQNHGINIFLIDWEDIGKEQRQAGYDTEIRPGDIQSLRDVSALEGATSWCRLNRFGTWTANEVEAAVDAGASGLFLPMVTTLEEIDEFLELIRGRCSSGILIETVEAVELVDEISKKPLNRIYFGLNDFSISREDDFIFKAVLDGTVEYVRNKFEDNVHFGFGGVTALGHGVPVPFECLVQEMARLDCSFSFLRRSFKRDVEENNRADVISDIHSYWGNLSLRTGSEVDRDHQRLLQVLRPLCS